MSLKRLVVLVVGFTVLVMGITLTLAWWPDVAVIFRGSIGVILALIGILILALAK